MPIDPDVRRASTLPASAYDEPTFRRSLDAVFARSWHAVDEAGGDLEGFHVPFVHPTLNDALDWNAYLVEPTPLGVTQIALASKDPRRASGPLFDLPPGHPDYGSRVAAYYF